MFWMIVAHSVGGQAVFCCETDPGRVIKAGQGCRCKTMTTAEVEEMDIIGSALMAIYMVGVGGFTSVDPEDEDKDQDEQVPTFDNSSRTQKF